MFSSWLQNGPWIILNTYSEEESSEDDDDISDGYIPSIFSLTCGDSIFISLTDLVQLCSASKPCHIHTWKENEEWYPWPDKVV